MKKNNENEEILEKISDLDKRLIEQEHRIFSIIRNVIKYSNDEPNKSKFKSAVVSLVSYFLKRQTLIIILSALTGIISFASIIISYQAKNLLTDQNDKIELQNQLIEADRRSSLVFLFNNIMDELSRDLRTLDTINKPTRNITHIKGGKFLITKEYSNLSYSLIGRIISLSRRLEPYKSYDYEKNDLSDLNSPERGQLLINLLESGASDLALETIFTKGTFEYADLKGYNNWVTTFKNINLSKSNMSNTDFHNGYFSYSNLEKANLKGADLSGSKIIGTNFKGANLSGASISKCTLKVNDFRNTDLNGLIIYSSDEPKKINMEKWISELRELGNKGLDYINENYKLKFSERKASGVLIDDIELYHEVLLVRK